MRLMNIRVVLLIFTTLLLMGCEKDHPKIIDSIDKIYFIGIDPLPKAWTADWEADKESAIRLKLLSPEKDLMLKVFAFKGNLDKKKFEEIDKAILGDAYTAPYHENNVFEYHTEVQRRKYKVLSKKGGTVFSELDILWYQAKLSYAYVIEIKYVGDGHKNIETARSSIHFYPPSLTELGKARNILGKVLDSTETIYSIIALVVGFLFGGYFLLSLTRELSLPIKSLIVFIAIVASLLCRFIFHLKWWACIVMPIVAVVVICIIIALLAGVIKIDTD